MNMSLQTTPTATAILVLSLAGSFVIGTSGGLAAVRTRLDALGVIALTFISGLGGSIIRDLLIGIPPATFRDWRYLAVLAAAGVLVLAAPGRLMRLSRTGDILDSAGLAFFCVTGCADALDHGLAWPEAAVLGTVSAVGSGALREIVLREIPEVLRTGLSGVPALTGALVVAVAWQAGQRGLWPIAAGAILAFSVRLTAIHYRLNLPVMPYQRP